jgi:hypothetical protein
MYQFACALVADYFISCGHANAWCKHVSQRLGFTLRCCTVFYLELVGPLLHDRRLLSWLQVVMATRHMTAWLYLHLGLAHTLNVQMQTP